MILFMGLALKFTALVPFVASCHHPPRHSSSQLGGETSHRLKNRVRHTFCQSCPSCSLIFFNEKLLFFQ